MDDVINIDLVDEYNIQLLGAAIIEQAIKDYRYACVRLAKVTDPDLSDSKRVRNLIRLKIDCEKFFLGERFTLFTNVSGPRVLELLKEQLARQINKNIKRSLKQC